MVTIISFLIGFIAGILVVFVFDVRSTISNNHVTENYITDILSRRLEASIPNIAAKVKELNKVL